MNPLAPTTFSSGPKDSLAAVDVYTAGKTTINSIQDKSTQSSFDISSILSNAGQGSVSSLTSLLKVNTTTGGTSLNTDALFSRLNSAVPTVTSSIKNLSSDAQKSLSTSFKDYGSVPVKMGGVVSQVDSKHAPDLLGYSNYVNDVNAYSTSLNPLDTTIDGNGSCSLYDVDSHASLISAGVNQGSSYGVSNAFSTLTSSPSVASNTDLLTKVTAASLPVLVKNGDLGNIKAMSATEGGQVFEAVLPNYGRTLVSNYSSSNTGRSNSFDTGASVNDYKSIISIFTNTNSSWNVFNRIGDAIGSSPTLNLLKLIGGTSEFQSLLAVGVKSLVDGDKSKHNILATMFGQTTVEDQIHRYFPKVILQSSLTKNQTSKANTIDPRVVSLIGKTSTSLIGNIGG